MITLRCSNFRGFLQVWLCPFFFATISFVASSAQERESYAAKRLALTEELRREGITDTKVLNVIGETDRHLFVPPDFRRLAYANQALPVGHGQTISQPLVVAYMTEQLKLEPGDKVLEIGTGSGYQAAILARLARSVISVEIIPELGIAARERLAKMGYANIQVRIGDGYNGWPEESPFNKIILTAAHKTVPAPLLEQLADGGILIAPLGSSFQKLVRIEKLGSKLHEEFLFPVRFVPLIRDKP